MGIKNIQPELPPFRPPSEARSLLIRVTRGCAWNRCGFCPMYKGVVFEIRDLEQILNEIEFYGEIARNVKELAWRYGYGNDLRRFLIDAGIWWMREDGSVPHVFLGDSDILAVKKDQLIRLLEALYRHIPGLKRVTAYARHRTILNRPFETLRELRKAGLTRLHAGLESGDDETLQLVKKGVTSSEAMEAGKKAIEAGFELSEYVILGLGGKKRWREHAEATARALNEINPHFIRVRTLFVVPGTPLDELRREGKFEESTEELLIREEIHLIENLNCRSLFLSDHVSNLLNIEGKLPDDKEKMLLALRTALENPPRRPMGSGLDI